LLIYGALLYLGHAPPKKRVRILNVVRVRSFLNLETLYGIRDFSSFGF